MQGNWTLCVPLKYQILMPNIQEAKCFEFTVQICPPHKFIYNYVMLEFQNLPFSIGRRSQRNWGLATNSNYLIPISSKPDSLNLG